MKIGKDGTIEKSSDPLGLTNEEIIFMYLSTRGAYLAHQKEIAKRKKQAKMIKTLLEGLDDDDEGTTIIKTGGQASKEEMLESLKRATEGLGENTQDPYIRSIYVKLFPYWVILRESAEDLVKEIIDKCFNEDSEIIKKMLVEEEVD